MDNLERLHGKSVKNRLREIVELLQAICYIVLLIEQ
jgi:hypothetical protein